MKIFLRVKLTESTIFFPPLCQMSSRSLKGVLVQPLSNEQSMIGLELNLLLGEGRWLDEDGSRIIPTHVDIGFEAEIFKKIELWLS